MSPLAVSSRTAKTAQNVSDSLPVRTKSRSSHMRRRLGLYLVWRRLFRSRRTPRRFGTVHGHPGIEDHASEVLRYTWIHVGAPVRRSTCSVDLPRDHRRCIEKMM